MASDRNVFIALGSNVEPERHLSCAVRELASAFPGIRFSPWYRNRPAGFEGQDFINLAAAFRTSAPVEDVQAKLHDVEARCGRTRSSSRAPPPIDIDLLIFGEEIRDEPGLTLPRPELLKRAYLLGPLADIAPGLVHPTARLTIAELWQRFDQAAHPLERIEPPRS